MAVHGGEEIERLGYAGEQHMLGDHRVEVDGGKVTEVLGKVLVVVVEVLTDAEAERVGEQRLEQEHQLELLVLGPVVAVERHEGNTQGFARGPGYADTGDVPGDRFYVDCEGKRIPARDDGEEGDEPGFYLGEGGSYGEVIGGVGVVLWVSCYVPYPLKVSNAERLALPLPHEELGGVGGNNSGGSLQWELVRKVVEMGTPPGIDGAVDACKGEHGEVADSDDNSRVVGGNLSPEISDHSWYGGMNPGLAKGLHKSELLRLSLFRRVQEVWLVLLNARLAHAGDVAFGADDAGLMEDTSVEVPHLAGKGVALPEVVGGGCFKHDHDFGRGRPPP